MILTKRISSHFQFLLNKVHRISTYSTTSVFINKLEERQPSQKVSTLVDTIANLSLLETADLVRLLKTRLNLPDSPMITMNHDMTSTVQTKEPTTIEKSQSTSEKESIKTEFQVTLVKYDAASKAKVIREVKNLIPGMNLVEAKTFVESAPKIIKEKVKKEEAEQLKKLLEELGATIKLE